VTSEQVLSARAPALPALTDKRRMEAKRRRASRILFMGSFSFKR
jgi:hypothetical protein